MTQTPTAATSLKPLTRDEQQRAENIFRSRYWLMSAIACMALLNPVFTSFVHTVLVAPISKLLGV